MACGPPIAQAVKEGWRGSRISGAFWLESLSFLSFGRGRRLAYNCRTMRTSPRVRIDRLIVDKGLAESREKAARHILAGEVYADDVRVDKAGVLVPPTAKLEVRGSSKYVSRGGEKLIHALEHFKVIVKGRICLDVGASTGGFTDCMLQRGASRVYAVDVGTGQLDARLRNDPRVVVMEHTNARTLD